MPVTDRKFTAADLADEVGITAVPASWRSHWDDYLSWLGSGGAAGVCWTLLPGAVERFDLPVDAVDPLREALETIARTPALSGLALFWHFLVFRLGGEIGENSNGWLMPAEICGVGVRLFSLAVLVSGFEQAIANCERDGMGEAVTRASLAFVGQRVREVRQKRGVWGIESLSFLRHYVRAELFRLGRLTFRVSPFPWACRAFHHRGTGQLRVLCASTTPPVNQRVSCSCLIDRGGASIDTNELPPDEWGTILAFGDLRVEVHIAGGSRLDPAEVNESYREAMTRFPSRHPGRRLAGFTCQSWLLDPALGTLLEKGSNIRVFAEPYRLLAVPGDNRQAYDLIFGDPDVDPTRFHCKTALQRGIADLVRAGGAIQSRAGFISWDDAVKQFASDIK